MSVNKIYKISASWCVQCKQLERELSNWDGVEIIEIDADENEEICEKYNIRGIPTLIFLDENNNELGRIVGMITKEQIQDFINELDSWNEIC